MTTTSDPRAEGLSTNAYCAQLMKQRHSHKAQGMILLLPRTGLVVVPFTQHRHGWDVVVVEGNDTYPRGGHHLFVGDAEIETAIELTLTEHDLVHDRGEADSLGDRAVILTADGWVLRKDNSWDERGVAYWHRARLQEPFRPDQLDRSSCFPARVLGTAKES